MFVQFGYVVLFSSAFPLAAMCALINNIIEIRSDAFKLCTGLQRPFGIRVESIGQWQVRKWKVNVLMWKLIQAHEVSPKHRGFKTVAVMSPCVINSGFVTIFEVTLSCKFTCVATNQLPLCGWNNWTEHNEANIKVIFLFSPLTDCDGGHGPDCHHRELLPDWSVWSAAATLPVAQPWDGHHLHRHPRGTTARPC